MAERLPISHSGDLPEQERAHRANHLHPPSRPKALTYRTMIDIHATILETFFFCYIDRNIGADETPLFTGRTKASRFRTSRTRSIAATAQDGGRFESSAPPPSQTPQFSAASPNPRV